MRVAVPRLRSCALALVGGLGCAAEPELVIVGARELGPIVTAEGVERREGGSSVYGFGGRSVWLFGETRLTSPDLDGLSRRSNGWAQTGDLSAIDGLGPFVSPIDPANGPAALFVPTAEELAFDQANPTTPREIQPLTAVRDDASADDRVLVFYAKRQLAANGEPAPIGSSIAVWTDLEFGPIRPVLDASSDEPTLLFRAPEPAFGQAALILGDQLYAYGCDQAVYHPCRLARVAVDAVFERDAWEFWTGLAWSPSSADAVALLEADTALTVTFNPAVGRYLAYYGDRERGELWVRAADRPEGPWSEPILAFTAAAAIADVAAHPEYRRSGGEFEYLSYRVGDQLRLVELELAGP